MAKQTSTAPSTQVATIPSGRQSLVAKFAGKYGVEPEKMLTTLKATAFKTGKNDPEVSNEQMMALLVVSDQYGLNPFLKEIYAFPDGKGGIIPMIPVDGWVRIINERPELDAIEFTDAEAAEGEVLAWIECSITRKDRSKPIRVREYMSECKRGTGPWQSHPRRMLRHKALIQAARVAFGFAGIYDPDEGERIREAIDVTPAGAKPRTTAPRAVGTLPETIEQSPSEQATQSLADENATPPETTEDEAGARG
jgi:phage recombination protein Bet